MAEKKCKKKSGKAARNKGGRGERELLGILNEQLGTDLKRNLTQVRGGGADCIELHPLALEIKFQETLCIPQWWGQAVAQADKARLHPTLAYRKSHQPWRFVVPFELVTGIKRPLVLPWCLTMEAPAFCELYREIIAGQITGHVPQRLLPEKTFSILSI